MPKKSFKNTRQKMHRLSFDLQSSILVNGFMSSDSRCISLLGYGSVVVFSNRFVQAWKKFLHRKLKRYA